MNNTPSCPICGAPLQNASCPTCASRPVPPPWPWLGSGAILLALALLVITHWPRPPQAPQRPPVATPAPRLQTAPAPARLPPHALAPYATGNTNQTLAPNVADHTNRTLSPAEALSGGDNAPEPTPGATAPDTSGTHGKPRYASNLELFKDVQHKDLAGARRLLSAFPAMVNERNYKGASGMQLAAIQDDAAMVRLFLTSGAEVDAKCNLYLYAGQTALHLTAGLGYTDVSTLLLAHGARVNAKNFTGETPLHEAAIQGRNAMVTLLLHHGAAINAVQQDGYTPLFFAAINGHLDTAKLLVARGANVNARANDGTTPASFAAMCGNGEIARFLHRHGGK